MTDSKVSGLTLKTDLNASDILYVIDVNGAVYTSNKITVAEFFKSINTLTANSSVLTTDRIPIIDDPSGTPLAQYMTVASLFASIPIRLITDSDVDTDEVILTGIASGIGYLMVGCSTDTKNAIYRVEGSTLTLISGNTVFSTAKDTGSKYNVYYETDQYKIQNKVGDNKVFRIISIGL